MIRLASFKEAILSGIIQPGEAIVESKIAQQLGAGIPLIREALIELEHQGYVQKVPYKGTTVTKLERREVEKIFRLRTELESLAVEWAKENVTPEDIEYLRGVTVKMKAAAQTLDLDQFYQNDLAFHRKLWSFRQRVSGRMPGANRGAAVRLLFDEGPPPRRVLSGQRRAARKDSRSAAPDERGEVAGADGKFGFRMED